MLQHLLKFQKKYGNDPTEVARRIVVNELAQSYLEAAPFFWETINFELTNLRTGMCGHSFSAVALCKAGWYLGLPLAKADEVSLRSSTEPLDQRHESMADLRAVFRTESRSLCSSHYISYPPNQVSVRHRIRGGV